MRGRPPVVTATNVLRGAGPCFNTAVVPFIVVLSPLKYNFCVGTAESDRAENLPLALITSAPRLPGSYSDQESASTPL
jgi:hypothetical protein